MFSSFQSGRVLCDSHHKRTTSTIPIRQTILYDPYPITCSLLFQSDKRFFIIPLSQDFFAIPFRQKTFQYSCSKIYCFHCPNPTKDSLLHSPLSNNHAVLFQSDKGFFIIPITKDPTIIPVRQMVLCYSYHKRLHHYKYSLLLFSRRVSLLFQSDKRFFAMHL